MRAVSVLPLLALLATFEPTGGVALSCLENVRGKKGRARVEVVIGVGAMHERESERGVAHLLEHLVLRPLGFDDGNGATGWDYTSYHRDVRAEELVPAAEALLAELRAPKLEPQDVEVEKRIVLRELEDRGTSHAEDHFDPLFRDTLLARYPGGTSDAVEALGVEDVTGFHRTHYVRGNVAVLLRGAVDCAEARATLAPTLEAFAAGPAAPRPSPSGEEPGRISLPSSPGAFVSGFYWYEATPQEEVIYRVVAKHLEQVALQELRKERGITYSPSGRFSRRGPGGQISLSVRTEGEERVVERWYEQTLEDLRRAPAPRRVLNPAFDPLRTALERDGVRAGLAAIRGEPDPLTALDGLDDDALRAALPKLLAERRAYGSTVPQSNVVALVILAVFGVVVLGALYFAFRAFMSHR